jgi:hypothetical protein
MHPRIILHSMIFISAFVLAFWTIIGTVNGLSAMVLRDDFLFTLFVHLQLVEWLILAPVFVLTLVGFVFVRFICDFQVNYVWGVVVGVGSMAAPLIQTWQTGSGVMPGYFIGVEVGADERKNSQMLASANSVELLGRLLAATLAGIFGAYVCRQMSK